MRSVWMALLAGALGFAGVVRAEAPAYLPVQGMLADADGGPVDGDVTMAFALYDADLGGTELWSETQTVLVEGGLFSVYLGDTAALDLSLFRDNGTMYLGVTVGTDAEMERFQIATTGFAAFAQYAGDAATIDGHAPSEFVMAGTTVDWSDLTGVPTDFVDGVDNDTTYTAGTGLTLTGTEFAADEAAVEGWARGVCYDTEAELTAVLDDDYAAQTHAHDFGDLTGVPADLADGDDDTTYSAGAGLALAGTTFSVSFAGTGAAATAARSDHTQAWTTLTGVPAGFADGVDNDTTYSAGAGLALTGTTFSLPTCAADQILRRTSTGWACSDDFPCTTVTATATLSATGGGAFASCPAGTIAVSGGYIVMAYFATGTCYPIRNTRSTTGTSWQAVWLSPNSTCLDWRVETRALCCPP